MIATLLCFAIGLLIGFYGDALYTKVSAIAEDLQDKREAKKVGVVRPIGTPATRNTPIDMSSDTGGIRKPTPAEIEDQRQEDRATALRINHQ